MLRPSVDVDIPAVPVMHQPFLNH